MKINKQTFDNAKSLLARYKEKHGAIAESSHQSTNCWGCGFNCIGTCAWGCGNACMVACNGSCRVTCFGGPYFY